MQFMPLQNIQLAQIYKDDGRTRQVNTFTGLAAASLFTSTADLAKFLEASISNNVVLSKETITKMIEPETFIKGTFNSITMVNAKPS